MAEYRMNLRLFEGGAGAGAAPAAAGDGGEAAVTPGVLEDGTQVDDRLAARMEEQARKRKARGEAPVRVAQKAAPQAEAQAQQPQQDPGLEDEWNEAKKGRFKEMFGRDVQAAIQDRFKNQNDATAKVRELEGKLSALEPMLEVFRNRAGVQSDEDLIKTVMDDDSLYEDAANEAGMTVSAYKQFRQMQQELDKQKAREQEEIEDRRNREHIQNLVNQGEELKKTFPDFDLVKEMQNETFRRLTMPGSGVDVRAAYYAIHHAELEPQVMAYGIQRAQQQMSQTLQANRQRPVEGAMAGRKPADVSIDPRKMTRQERQQLLERAARGEKIVF